MCRYILLILIQISVLCTINNSLSAQNNNLSIFVKDSVSNNVIEGAAVKLFYGKDVVVKATDKNGICNFIFMPDRQYFIIVSHIGYKTINKGMFFNSGTPSSLTILLSEEATKLNELLIKGDLAMMIIKGDTVKYNISSLKTFDGDNLIEAIRMIPGITVDGGNVLHFGIPVSRIYVNKTLLFGKEDPSRALVNLKANEVKQVEVYEESTDESKLIGLENGSKNKVMNIITKNKLNSVVNSRLTSAIGKEEKHEESKYHISGDFKSFNVKRQFQSSIFSENVNPTNADRVRYRSNSYSINYSNQITAKTSIVSNIFIRNSSIDNKTINYRQYNSQHYPARESNDTTFSNNTDKKSIYTVILNYFPNNKNNLSVIFSLNNRGVTDRQIRRGYINESGSLLSSYNNSYYDSYGGYDYGFTASWTGRLGKPGRSLGVSLIYKRDKTLGDGWQRDTSNFSANRYNIIKRKDGSGTTVTGRIRYSEPVYGGMLQIDYNINNNKGESQRSSVDLLSGNIDTTATFNYSNNNINQGLKFGFTKASGNWNMTSVMGLDYVTYLRYDYFPKTYNFNKNLVGFSSNFSFKKNINIINSIEFTYQGTSSFPTIEELRDVVDFKNPLFIKAGNPYLKTAYNYTSQIKFTHFTEMGSVITVTVSGNNIINGLAARKFYFSEDTYIGKYHFVFPKGSTLSSFVNTGGMWGSNSEISYSKNIADIKSIITINAGHNFTQTPFYVNETKFFQLINTFNLSLRFQSNFSQKLQMTLLSNSMIDMLKTPNLQSSRSFRQSTMLMTRALIYKNFDIKNSFSHTLYINPYVTDSRQNFLIWDINLTGKLIKNKLDISLMVRDVLNSYSKKKINVTEDYIENISRTDIIQRTFLVSISFYLNRRK